MPLHVCSIGALRSTNAVRATASALGKPMDHHSHPKVLHCVQLVLMVDFYHCMLVTYAVESDSDGVMLVSADGVGAIRQLESAGFGQACEHGHLTAPSTQGGRNNPNSHTHVVR